MNGYDYDAYLRGEVYVYSVDRHNKTKSIGGYKQIIQYIIKF